MNEKDTVERLARIETHIESMAKTLEEIARDHESRLREIETRLNMLWGVLKLAGAVGIVPVAGFLYFLATK